jgi:hypothetical protein
VLPPIVIEVSANFLRIEGCRVVSAADPYGRNPDFLDRKEVKKGKAKSYQLVAL